MFLEVMIEDEAGGEVDQQELVEWADTYGLTMPVLSDPGSATLYTYATGGGVGLPYMVLYDRGAVVEQLSWVTMQDVDALNEE